jgi:flagellin-specific chaperone FliS
MLGLMQKIFGWIKSIFSSLSEEEKTKVIESIVATFDWFLRKFYQANKAN